MSLLRDGHVDLGPGPVLFVHAHPDDETLATGVLIAELVARGVEVVVLTATRGEMGEVVPGVLDEAVGAEELDRVREAELAAALNVLGVRQRAFLGTPPARVTGAGPRRYRDSGMRWVTPTTAGPALEADHRSLTAAGLDDVVADLGAYLDLVRPAVLVGYDIDGSYGHPDHVRCHHATVAAGRAHGVPVVEVVSVSHGAEGDVPDAEWVDLSGHRPLVLQALAEHRSQLTLTTDDDGEPQVVHVGGQREGVIVRIGLRRVPGTSATD